MTHLFRTAALVQAEDKTDLLKISFSRRDPVIAAEFVNTRAEAFVARQAELLNVATQLFGVQEETAGSARGDRCR